MYALKKCSWIHIFGYKHHFMKGHGPFGTLGFYRFKTSSQSEKNSFFAVFLVFLNIFCPKLPFKRTLLIQLVFSVFIDLKNKNFCILIFEHFGFIDLKLNFTFFKVPVSIRRIKWNRFFSLFANRFWKKVVWSWQYGPCPLMCAITVRSRRNK